MPNVLTVGRIESEFAATAAIKVATELDALPLCWLGRAKTVRVPWLGCETELETWQDFNEASTCQLLAHAAELEGISIEARLVKTKWPHLPDYQETYWLPLDFSSVRVFDSPGGWPIAIASVIGLLRDLEALRSASPDRLLAPRPVPSGGDRHAGGNLSPIWWRFHEAASTAIARSAPLSLIP